VEWLVREGGADPDRLGVYGYSYGAGMINRLLGRTDRFRAAVAQAGGILPPGVQWAGMIGGNPLLAREYGGKPWEVPEVYERHDALRSLHHARTPTLILNGESEDDIGAWALYTWLHQLGVPVEYIVYKGEGHAIRKAEHRADQWRRTLAWFDRHLRVARHTGG
jgi:dipeptidyl aminopeptidase/acylaminoacyl peptidase